MQTPHEAAEGLELVVAGEVIGPEVAVGDAVAEHIVAGAQHRGGDGKDGFLRAAARLEAQELGTQVRALGADGGPSGGHQGRLEPRGAVADPGGPPFPGALVAERLRTMLDTEDPGAAADYPCFLSVLYVAGERRANVMLQAKGGRTEGQRAYRLVFAGFHWMFVVSSHTQRHRMASTLALQPDGRFYLHGFEGMDSEGLRALARRLMLPNEQNVQRLRGESHGM
jgi:hypothetical protein